MFIVSNFLLAIARVLDIVLWLFMLIVIARALISWVSPDPYNPIVRFLYNATEPLLYRLRRYLPPLGAIDLSPLVLILVLIFLQVFFVQSLQQLAFALR
jgi:YggT family protein